MNWWRRLRHLKSLPRRYSAEGRLFYLPVALLLAALYVLGLLIFFISVDPGLLRSDVHWGTFWFRVVAVAFLVTVLVFGWSGANPPRRIRWVWDCIAAGVVGHFIFAVCTIAGLFVEPELLRGAGAFLLIYSRIIWGVAGGVLMVWAVAKLTTELTSERREREAVEAVVDFTRRMSSLDYQEIMDEAVSHIYRLLKADACVLFLWSDAEQALVPMANQHDPTVYKEAYINRMMAFKCPRGFGLTGWTMETGQPTIVGDVMTDPRSQGVPGWTVDEKSSMITPLQVEGRRLGVIRITRRGLHQFTRDDLDLAMSFSRQAALVIEHGRVVKELQDLAITDSLTGLFNSRYFQTVLTTEVDRAQRYQTPLALVMLDSDSLKRLNDRLGHQAGDAYLTAIGQVLKESIRLSDYAFRYAGDEFLLLLPNTGSDEAVVVAERVRAAIATLEPGSGLLSSISAGVAVLPDHAPDGEALLSAADSAMYESKRSGKNRVTLASEAQRLQNLSL